MQLKDIETSTSAYARQRELLRAAVTELNVAVELLKRKHLPVIRKRVDAAAEAHADLKADLEASPGLFVKPRSVVIAGIKVGYAKGKGKIEYGDEDKLVAAIRKLHPDLFDVLVSTTYKPVKKALNGLEVAELRKLGITVEDTDDYVVIAPVDSEVDKIVTALLTGASEEAGG